MTAVYDQDFIVAKVIRARGAADDEMDEGETESEEGTAEEAATEEAATE